MFESSVGQEHLPAEKAVVCVDVQGVFEILVLSSITSWCERNLAIWSLEKMDKIPNHNRERFGATPPDRDPHTLNNKVLFSSQS